VRASPLSVTSVIVSTRETIEAGFLRRLILASASPRRQQAFRLLGLPFEVDAAQVDESPRQGESPADLVQRLSLAKARAVAACTNGLALVVGADTAVEFESESLGKPGSVEEAYHMLLRLRGQIHQVHSAIAMIDTESRRESACLSTTQVQMRNYALKEIETYVASGDPFDKAGGYAIQHAVFHPAVHVVGCYSNVMGVPLRLLVSGLQSAGLALDVDAQTLCVQFTGRTCTASCREDT
jgi:septum formation protein